MAVFKENPDFGLYLAEQAVRQHFHDEGRKLCRQMAEFCRKEPLSNLRRVYLRLQRQQMNSMIVESVLRSLPDLKQRFMYYRYGQEETYTRIENRLHASVKLLNEWNKEILGMVERMLFYALGKEDVYCRLKVMNMVHVLDFRINALLESGVPVNQEWLSVLMERRGLYRRLIQEMDCCLRHAGESTYHAVVALKLLHPSDNKSEIAHRLGKGSGCVGKNLKKYEARMCRYVIS